eukprot:7519700-Pyramimonas_sp.AAC.1
MYVHHTSCAHNINIESKRELDEACAETVDHLLGVRRPCCGQCGGVMVVVLTHGGRLADCYAC